MDRYSRSIYLSLFILTGLTVTLLAAAATIAFPVDLDSRITRAQGEVKYGLPRQTPAVIDDDEFGPLKLRVGEFVQVAPSGMATVMFFNGGFAVLNGPASLLLRESSRKATAWDHVRRSRGPEVEYALTIEQNAGTIDYYFDNADPALERVVVRIHLPNEVYIPTASCWQIKIDAAGQASTQTISCSSPR